MSGRDHGAFGQLLAELKELGGRFPSFVADLQAHDESTDRWTLCCVIDGRMHNAGGRTGEEALRALVARVRAA